MRWIVLVQFTIAEFENILHQRQFHLFFSLPSHMIHDAEGCMCWIVLVQLLEDAALEWLKHAFNCALLQQHG
jgi:hypothetical protein